jgi:hypothetical protein
MDDSSYLFGSVHPEIKRSESGGADLDWPPHLPETSAFETVSLRK